MDINEGWIQVLSLFLANAGLIIWFRTESRNDWRHMDNKLDTFMREVQEERKEFHGRLERQDAEFKAHLLSQHAK